LNNVKFRILYLCIVFSIALSLIACKTDKNPIGYNLGEYKFAIHFLQDPSIKMDKAVSMNIGDLALEPQPWLSDEDIRYYDFSSHCIYLKDRKGNFFPNWSNDYYLYSYPDKSWWDKPFVVVAEGKQCYLGYLQHLFTSNLWPNPSINESDIGGYPEDIFFINWQYLYQDDLRDNVEVNKALLDGGIYRGGIDVRIDTTNFVRFIDNADTTTIEYTYTITNNDLDNLYVFDPDIMGSDLFHYFTNGPTFQNIETLKVYRARWRNNPVVEPYDYWTEDWFMSIKPGQAITKTVILKGYPYFPLNEEYIVQFRFPGLMFNAEKDRRETEEGRYWLGSTLSNVLQFELIGSNKISPTPLSTPNINSIEGERESSVINQYRSNLSMLKSSNDN